LVEPEVTQSVLDIELTRDGLIIAGLANQPKHPKKGTNDESDQYRDSFYAPKAIYSTIESSRRIVSHLQQPVSSD